MASRKDKTAYDALLRDARALTDDLDLTREENYSLEEILAEYGGGRERKILDDVERQVAGEALPEAEAPAAGSDPGRSPERGPKPAEDREAAPFRVPEAAKPEPGPGPEDGGCYLTTACVRARGLADDCAALETLRGFRDGYLARTADGRREIERYYAIAPEIVAAIEDRPDSPEIWEQLYAHLIEPCVEMIHRGENERAYRHYRDCALRLRDAYCPRRF